MANFSDTFTGSDGVALTAHTSDSGHSWTIGVGANDPSITSNRIRNTGPGGSGQSAFIYNGCLTADGNYDLSLPMRCVTALAYAGGGIKYIPASANRYWWWWDGTKFEILKNISSVQTSLASSSAYSLTAGNDYTVLCEVREAAGTVTMTLKVNGTTVATATDTSITGQGRTGLFFRDGSSTTGLHFDSMTSTDFVSSSLSLTSPVARQTFQRSGTTGVISIAGSASGGEDIEASFNGGAYSTIATAVSGSFTGTLTGQAQGQGTLIVRQKITTANSVSVSNVGIGEVFLVTGDSISEGRGNSAQSYTHATLLASVFRQDNAWSNGNDAVDTGTTSGSHWPLLATLLMADLGVPVAFITTGTGGTDVDGSYTTWAKPGTEYTNATASVTASKANSVRGVLHHCGPNAAHGASTPTQTTYSNALSTMAANFAADVAGAPKTVVVLMGQDTIGTPPDRRAGIDGVRKGVLNRWTSDANIKPGPSSIEASYSDGVHPKTNTELQALANRWWVAIKAAFFSGSVARGPRLSSATWNGARNQLTVVFDQSLKTGLTHGAGAWAISDSGSAMTISGIAYHGTNPAALVISTTAAAVGAAGTTTVTFASGNDAAGVVVPLSADVTLPTSGAVNLPAEPIYAATVAEATSTSVTVRLGTAGGVARPGLTGIYWMLTTGLPPSATIVQQGSGETTDGAGDLVIDISASGLAPGASAWLHYSNGAASPSTQAGSVPVTVA